MQAQKLLFKYSDHGNLLQVSSIDFDNYSSSTVLTLMFCSQYFKYLSGHFDTKVGLKSQPNSYAAISEEIGVESNNILFLTDIGAGKISIDKIMIITFHIFRRI